MPPAGSSSGSDSDGVEQVPAKAKAVKSAESEDEGSESEDEYQVEKIMSHNFQRGKVIYEIKWLGYDDESDRTWEPIENLDGAKDLLDAYHRRIGGTPEPPSKGKKPSKASLGKRSASGAGFDSPAPSGKKGKGGRKSELNGGEDWAPPELGLWEDHITRVSAIVEGENTDGMIRKGAKAAQSLEGLLEWNNGKKTQHTMAVLRQKCPQRLLDYYESHLVFQGDPRYLS